MLLNVSGVAIVAGGSTPLAFLLGGIACLALAFVVIGFTRRMASAGYAYTYASRSLGKESGFMAGWLYFAGMICFVPMTMSGVGYLAAEPARPEPRLVDPVLLPRDGAAPGAVDREDQGHHPHPAGRGHRDRGRHRDRRPVHHGQGRQSTARRCPPSASGTPLSGGFNGVFYGIILGVTSYIGFETAADFGEETANPRRYIPIAIIAATGFAVVFYLWTTYAMAIGFGVNNGAKWGADPVALQTIANKFVTPWVGTLVEIGGLCRGVHRVRRVRDGGLADAVRHGPRGRAAQAVRPYPPAVQDAGQRDARGGRDRHRDGAAGRATRSPTAPSASRSATTTSGPPWARC